MEVIYYMAAKRVRKSENIRRDNENNRLRWLDYRMVMHDSELRKIENLNKEPVLGHKQQILKAFEKNQSIEEAYEKAKEINSKLSKEVYSKATLKNGQKKNME